MILHSQILGKGNPFVILHGFLGMSDNWKTLGTRFSESGYQVHLVDQRNHGRSFHSDEFSYEIMVEDLKSYCNEHDLQDIVLLGHSMGGKTAMQFAVTYPVMVIEYFAHDVSRFFLGIRVLPIYSRHEWRGYICICIVKSLKIDL